MVKRLLTTTLVAAGLSLGLAGVAAAAPAKTAAISPSTVERPAVWFTYNTYVSLPDCQYAGEYLVSVGAYKGWACQE